MRFAVLSYHTSPLAQPGVGDGGGMNVYVKRLASALVRSGADCDVYTRSTSAADPARIVVEPGFVVHNIPAGPPRHLEKEELLDYVEDFKDEVLKLMLDSESFMPDLIHSNYWLSGIAGHSIKHELDIPMLTTFHTLEKVKSFGRTRPDDGYDEAFRVKKEIEIMGCSDSVLVSCAQEMIQLVDLYGISPERVEVVTPGVDHAFFAPGAKAMARQALGLNQEKKLLLWIGRIQPLKAPSMAVAALGLLAKEFDVEMVMIGGPSGSDGAEELNLVKELAESYGVRERLHLISPQPHETISSYYRAADLCLITSRTESFGLVALEAASCGLVTVASDVGGLTSVIDGGMTGILVAERSPEKFAEEARGLLLQPDLMKSMSRAAVEKSFGYTWSYAARQMSSIARSLLARELLSCC